MYDHRLFFQCVLVLLNAFSQCRLIVSDISIDDDNLITFLQKTSLPTWYLTWRDLQQFAYYYYYLTFSMRFMCYHIYSHMNVFCNVKVTLNSYIQMSLIECFLKILLNHFKHCPAFISVTSYVFCSLKSYDFSL